MQIRRIPLKQLDTLPARPTGTKHSGAGEATATPVEPANEAAPPEVTKPVEAMEPTPIEPATPKIVDPETSAVEPAPEAKKAEPPVKVPRPDPEPDVIVDAAGVEEPQQDPEPLDVAPEPVSVSVAPATELVLDSPTGEAPELDAKNDATSEPLDLVETVKDDPTELPPSSKPAYLTLDSEVTDAPSIGPKTAARLEKVGVFTVLDLLGTDPNYVAEELSVAYITPEAVQDWQDQAQLMLDVPGLRVHDTQILVGAGIRTKEDLANTPAKDIFDLATSFLSTSDGKRVLRKSQTLDEDEIHDWIDMAKG